MSRQNFSEGQEVVFQDLNDITRSLEKTVLDDILEPYIGQQGFFSDSFLVFWEDSDNIRVSVGSGLFPVTSDDPEPSFQLIVNDDDTTLYSIEAPDLTNDRIDIVQVRPAQLNDATEARNFKALDGSISAEEATIRTKWGCEVQIKTGIPAGSPVAPGVDPGWFKIAELLVEDTSGIDEYTGITDTREKIKIISEIIDELAEKPDYTEQAEGATGSVSWFGGSPAGTTASRFRWIRVGNKVDFYWRWTATTPSTGVTDAVFSLPTGCPKPKLFDGVAVGENHYSGSAYRTPSGPADVAYDWGLAYLNGGPAAAWTVNIFLGSGAGAGFAAAHISYLCQPGEFI